MISFTFSSKDETQDGAGTFRATVITFMVAIFLLTLFELGFRAFVSTRFPTVPGLTKIEFGWKLAQIEREALPVLMVGDSRAGWGFSEDAFEQECRRRQHPEVHAHNLGLPASSAAAIVRRVIRDKRSLKGVLLVNFSPAGFYRFNEELVSDTSVPLQDFADEKLRTAIQSKIVTYGRNWTDLFGKLYRKVRNRPRTDPGWVARMITPDGIAQAELASESGEPIDVRGYQQDYYGMIVEDLKENRARALERKRELIAVLHEAQRHGWTVVLVQLPVGEGIRRLEAELPADLQGAAIAEAVGAPFVDLSAADFPTVDDSHLTVQSARAVSRDLAAQLVERQLLK